MEQVRAEAMTSEREFADWVEPHLPAMWRFAASLSSADDAEDLVQNSLLRAWVKRESFDPARGSATGWLLAIVADQARAWWRRRPEPRLVGDRIGADRPVDGPEPTGMDIDRAVDRLAHRQRLAFVLRYYVDLPTNEVAEVMGVSAGTVKSTLHDARRALRQALEESDDD